jgi:hypothetical protein
VFQALHEHDWIAKIDLGCPFTLEHLRQFVERWSSIPSPFDTTSMMTSFGGSLHMAATPPSRPTRCNSLGRPPRP